jgi:hypothetical protein
MTKVADGQIDGYTSAVSVAPGETVELHVNVEVEQDVQWELFRIGDYQGHGARSVAVGEPARVAIQPVCPPDPLTGLIECNWATAFRVAIAAD